MRFNVLRASRRCLGEFASYGLTLGLLLSPHWLAAQTAASAPTVIGPVVKQIAPGAGHACALTTQSDTGKVAILCWGSNNRGQLGIGTTTDSLTPVKIDPTTYLDSFNLDTPVVQLASGDNHSCALLPAHGYVVCWGANDKGQLGNGDTTDSLTPVHNAAMLQAAAIAAGSAHTCALLADGTVQCWGDNARGQLGNGSTGQSATAVAVKNVSNAIAIAAGGDHTCALVASGQVVCWGENGNGQLGNAGTSDVSTPVAVSALGRSVTTLALGKAHTCALSADGSMQCWGSNAQGQLGHGSADSSVPVAVSVITGLATSIAAGSAHTCATLSDGSVQCWGSNQKGQLGSNAVNNSGLLASRIAGNFVELSAGSADTCAQDAYGVWRCWGDDALGQLGNGAKQVGGILTPLPVIGLADQVASIAVGDLSTCVVTQAGSADLVAGGQTRISGTTYCMGSNSTGQLGNDSTSSSAIPNATPSKVLGLDDAVVEASIPGTFHTCFLLADGTVRCTGFNDFGQLGDGTTTNSTIPVKVIGLSGVTAISIGERHTCALLADKTVSCWGWNNSGQLASATLSSSSTPVRIPGLTDVVSIKSGQAHTCALRSNGSVWCWGYNGNGELGRGTRGGDITDVSVPTEVSGVGSVTAISAGISHNCALTANGTVACWGSGANGELGNGAKLDSSGPVQVSGLSGVTAISVGGDFSCAVLSDKTASCWGANIRGALGDGTLLEKSLPVAVKGLSGVTALVTGTEHVCAVLSAGPIQCWGGNTAGNIGPSTSAYGNSSQYGSDHYTTTPVPLLVGQSLSFTPPAAEALYTSTDLVPTASSTSGMTTTFDSWTGIQCEIDYDSTNINRNVLYAKAPFLCGVRAQQTGGYNYVQGGSSAAAPGQLRLVQVGTVATAPQAALNPTSLAFGNIDTGNTSDAKVVTLSNAGNAALTISTIEITSTNADLFQQTNTCGSTLQPGANCNISVTFSPKSVGSFSASVTVTDNASDSSQSAALSGSGVSADTPQADLAPNLGNFGSVSIGSTSAAQTFTLANRGTASLPITSVGISGAGGASFTITANTCGSSLAAGNGCAISVTFVPTTAGTSTGILSVYDGAGTQTASLTGTGVVAAAPQAALTPGTAAFGSVNIGTASTAQVFTLANPGNAPLSIASVSILGANASSFQTTANNCGPTLGASGSCKISITFSPSAAGSASASLSIVDAVGTQTAALSGTGSALSTADFSISASSPPPSIQRGSSISIAVQVLSLTANNPFNGPVVLSASGLPSGVTATFTSPSVIPGVGQAATVGMVITVPKTAADRSGDFQSKSMAVAAAVSFGSLFFFYPRRRRRRSFGLFVLLLASGAFIAGMSGCGDGVARSESTITITGASGSTIHSTTVVLGIK